MTKKINSKERCDILLIVFEQRTLKIPTFRKIFVAATLSRILHQL